METKLTQEEKRIKIAEACGWERLDGKHCERGVIWPNNNWVTGKDDCVFMLQPLPDKRTVATTPPNYFECLNAITAAVRTIPYAKQCVYMKILTFQVMMKDEGVSDFERHTAEPPAMCEAFGLTLKLWEAGE